MLFNRFPNDECPSVAILLSIQSIVGVIINACMAGIIFAKFTVPRNRGQVSISPTFEEQLFLTKAFSQLTLCVCIFWKKRNWRISCL